MCLTIPAQVVAREGQKAIIQDREQSKKVDISAVPGVKKGDWILYISNQAIKKLSSKDAKEILDLLIEKRKKIDFKEISPQFRKIITKSKKGFLDKKDIIYLLNSKGQEKQTLFSEANTVRQAYLKDFICIHGIIEFSNFCKNDCFYCGLRCQNRQLKRYRMDINEIVRAADQAVNQKNYKLLVLQSGEDYFYTDDDLIKIITKIKQKCRAFIFMSVGERGYDCYKKMKQAGASGVLFRFETSNPKLFKKLHLKGKNFKSRPEHLKFMRELGYFIATGSIIGLPRQTAEDLADDILMIKKWANMVSMGPFVPCDNTPLVNYPHGDPEMNLKMITVLRLLMPETRIPVVTALETLLGEKGRKRALQAGANSLMFNLTPAKYRSLYRIYPDKFFKKEEMWEKYGLFKHEESYQMLEQRMQKELLKNINVQN